MQEGKGGGIRGIYARHNKNTGQVEKLRVTTWDKDNILFGDRASSGDYTRYDGSETAPVSCLGYLGGVVEGEVARVVMYWVPV